MSEQKQNEQQEELRDLDVSDEQAEEVKGGAIFLEYEGIKGDVKPPTWPGSR